MVLWVVSHLFVDVSRVGYPHRQACAPDVAGGSHFHVGIAKRASWHGSVLSDGFAKLFTFVFHGRVAKPRII
jgi:hypothetical protein